MRPSRPRIIDETRHFDYFYGAMLNDPLTLTVITPEREVISATASSVTLPVHDGSLGVLNLRAPLLGELGIGQLSYQSEGETRRVYIDGGFAQVVDNGVKVLTPQAFRADEIDAEVIERAESAAGETDGVSAEERHLNAKRLQALRKIKSN